MRGPHPQRDVLPQRGWLDLNPRSPDDGAQIMWREDDEALLARLMDELLLERLWRFQAGDVPPPHPRASGMFAQLRKMPGGAQILSEALNTERYDALFALLLPKHFRGAPPELLHHLALYYASLADALALKAEQGEAALFARKQSLAAWFKLAEQKDYLLSLARAMSAGALSAAETERAVFDAPMECLEELGRAACEGAHERTRASYLALRQLGSVSDACRIAGVPAAVSASFERRAQKLQTMASDAALGPIYEALAEAKARGDIESKAVSIFQQIEAIWRWTGEDENIETFAVEQVTPIAWDIQRDSRYAELRTLLSPVIPLSDNLARRVESDPTRIAYAAPCAQIFVFRCEMDDDAVKKLEYAERSVKLCPSHRNGRLMLASCLCDLAVRTMSATGWYVAPDAIQRAEAYLKRAEQLFPSLKKIESTKSRLDEAKRKSGGAFMT